MNSKHKINLLIGTIPLIFTIGFLAALTYASSTKDEYSACTWFDGQNISFPFIINQSNEESFVLNQFKQGASSVACNKFKASYIEFENYGKIVKVK